QTRELLALLELPVLDVQRMPAEPGPVGEQHPGGILAIDRGLDRDRVRAVPDVRRDRLWDFGGARVVHVAVPRLGQLRPFGGEDLNGTAVLQRQRTVLA